MIVPDARNNSAKYFIQGHYCKFIAIVPSTIKKFSSKHQGHRALKSDGLIFCPFFLLNNNFRRFSKTKKTALLSFFLYPHCVL